jgi:hypothetical protein
LTVGGFIDQFAHLVVSDMDTEIKGEGSAFSGC